MLDQIMTFVQEKWVLILIAIIVIFLIMKLLKTVVKWVIILAIIGGLIFYGTNYIQQTDISNLLKQSSQFNFSLTEENDGSSR